MISKGTTHNNGAKLASYMTASQDGQHAELWQFRGFEAANIKDAFRDVHIMAEATKCTQPFFHLQVRNRDGETLTRQQWEIAADRIERMLGLSGQPRAIAFHTYDHNGAEHMHVAWSRIDQDTLTAKPLPFFKERLKKISRELEMHFALEPVTNHREGHIKYAPTRAEHEQARRLGVDIHDIRNTIRACWDHSDNGCSFEAALADKDLILARGDRRDFVVIDYEGGMHVLGKRILDVSAAKIRTRMSDLVRDELPSVLEVRAFVVELKMQNQQEQTAQVWDRERDTVRDEIQWQDALDKAAIAKEARERRFVEPKDREQETRAGREQGTQGRRKERQEEKHAEKKWPVTPPQHQSWPDLVKAAAEATRDERVENLKGPAAKVWDAFCHSDSAKAYVAALDDQGIMFAAVTKEEAKRSQREAAFARELGRRAPRFTEGEIVIITEPRPQYQRNGEIIEPPRIHKLDQSLAAKLTRGLDNAHKLQGIDATLKASDERALQRAAEWREIRLQNATNGKGQANTAAANIKGGIHRSAAIIGKAASFAAPIGKVFDAVGGMVESLAAPKLTPEQIRDGEKAKARREAEADTIIDFSRVTAETAQQRRQMEQDREADRKHDGGGRER